MEKPPYVPAGVTSVLIKEPIYQQLNQHLRALISSGEFAIGSKFLTEREVCERFQVSRVTANKALSNLVSEGLLEFRKGVGTFVRGKPMDYNLRALVSFTEEALAAGKTPSSRVLQFMPLQTAAAPAKIGALFGKSGGDLYYVERLRLADATPLIFEKRYIAARHCPGLNESDLAGSIYSLWSQRYHLAVEGADQTIRAVNLAGADAKALQVREGTAGLLVTSLGYLAGHEPLWFERTLYRGDAYEFHNRLAGVEHAGLPTGRFLELNRD